MASMGPGSVVALTATAQQHRESHSGKAVLGCRSRVTH